MDNGQSAEKDYAYLLGLCFGDGHIEKRSDNNYIFRLEAIDKDFIEYTASILSKIKGSPVETKTLKRKTSKGNEVYSCSLGNIYFRKIYEDSLGLQVIPKYVYLWNRNLRMEFIKGILDSDGYISMRSNGHNTNFECGYRVTYSWILDVKRIITSLGIETKKICEVPQKAHKKDVYAFRINLKSLASTDFGFNVQRKQLRLDTYRQKHNLSQRLYARPEQG